MWSKNVERTLLSAAFDLDFALAFDLDFALDFVLAFDLDFALAFALDFVLALTLILFLPIPSEVFRPRTADENAVEGPWVSFRAAPHTVVPLPATLVPFVFPRPTLTRPLYTVRRGNAKGTRVAGRGTSVQRTRQGGGPTANATGPFFYAETPRGIHG